LKLQDPDPLFSFTVMNFSKKAPARSAVQWAVLACLSVAATPTFSQTSTLQTVEVVGTTPLGGIGVETNKFPANAQVLDAKDVQEQGVNNMADLLNNHMGSVSVSNGTGNPYQNDVNYRGFQASSLLGAPVGLSVYVDGVRMNEPFGSVVNWDLIPMNAMSRTSVLPGSNPMFGLNTLGGALVMETKNGQDHAGTSMGVLAGSFNRRRVNFETGWADQANSTDYFLAANFDTQDGYRNFSGSDVKQLFAKGRWRGNGGNTLLELSGIAADNTLRGTQSLPMDMMGNPSAAYTSPDSTSNRMTLINLKGSHALDDANQLVGNIFYKQGTSRNINSNAQLDDGCFNADGSLALSGTVPKCANKAPGGTAVNSVTNATALALGYGRWTSSINSSLVDATINQDTWGTGLQWSNFDRLLGQNNTFTLGGSYDSAKIKYTQNTYLARLVNYETVVTPNLNYGFTSNGLLPSANNLPAFTGSNVLGSVGLDATTTNLSVYFTDTLSLSEQLHLTASGSFNQTNLNQSGANNQYLNDDGGFNWTSGAGVNYYNPAYIGSYKSQSAAPGVSAVTVPANSVAGPQTNSLNGNHRYQRFNPAVGFNFNLDKDNGFFGSYSEAMRAPTAIELSCADPNSPCALPTGFNGDPELKAVVARTFELGMRGRLGEHTSWNAAIYDSQLSDDIQFIAASSTRGYFNNVGDTQRRGFEIGARTQIDRLYVSANYGYVDALYKSAFTTAAGQSVMSGNRIPGIASQTLKIRAAVAVNADLMVGANVIAVGPQYAHGNESNTVANGVVSGYTLLNLDAHYQISKDVRVSANLHNALNQSYSTYGLSGITSIYTLANQNFLTPAAPRGLWVALTYKFGA
jgi:outer membrane receptor protein involved in Fe transport